MRPNRVRLPATIVALLALVVLAVTAALAPPASAAGGKGSAELGLDGAVSLRIFDKVTGFLVPARPDDAFLVDLPVQSFRVGFFATDAVEIEPAIGFTLVSQGGDTAHAVDLGLDVLCRLSSGEGATPFFAVGGGIQSLDYGSGSKSQGRLNGGLGVKLPIADRSAFRLHGVVTRNLDNSDFLGSWDLGIRFGYSFFTRASR
jgi:hypothetical protein